MNPVRVYLVSHFAPAAVGHGGVHRSFQLECDARTVVGETGLASVNLEHWRAARRRAECQSQTQPAPLERRLRTLRRNARRLFTRARQVRDNPFKLFRIGRYPTAIPFSTTAWVEPEFVTDYARLVANDRGPKVCVVEHAVFGAIVELNRKLGVPTISAFQNIEALDVTTFEWHSRKHVYSIMTDLGNELRLLGQCAGRLCISKVEAGFVGGLGLECQYYPYLPVGAIRDNLWATRLARAAGPPKAGAIVLLGSAGHAVTGQSMRWFIQNARVRGLPSGVRVVAVGSDTDALLPSHQIPPGLELRGFVSQAELDALLVGAAAVVIPQRLGFGALTRFPELACAGVPVIAFDHPTHAINPTPGLRTVAADWQQLCAAMQDAVLHPCSVGQDEYERWEAEQPRPLSEALRRVLHGSTRTWQ